MTLFDSKATHTINIEYSCHLIMWDFFKQSWQMHTDDANRSSFKKPGVLATGWYTWYKNIIVAYSACMAQILSVNARDQMLSFIVPNWNLKNNLLDLTFLLLHNASEVWYIQKC